MTYPRDTFVRHVPHRDFLSAVHRGDTPIDVGDYCHHHAHSMLFETSERAWRDGLGITPPAPVTDSGSHILADIERGARAGAAICCAVLGAFSLLCGVGLVLMGGP